MKQHTKWLAKMTALAGGLLLSGSAIADTNIVTFDENFFMDGLFAWSDATVVANNNGYSITDMGYGSGYKAINPNIDGSGNTNIELTVTLSGPGGDGFLGPIVKLVDGDGTGMDFAWYGQTLGSHVLNANLATAGILREAGADSKLNLATLSFFHLQLDPSSYSGQYTIRFEKLRLTGPAGPIITAQSYNASTREFTLIWSSLPGKTYTLLHSVSLTGTFSSVATGIESGGPTTTNTATLPVGNIGFLRVQQEP
jgi:hypothetical protein